MNIRSLSDWWDATLVIVGSIIGAISVIVFLVPSEIAPGGVSGLAVILNALIGFPLGLAIILGNIPIQYLGYSMLGGSKVLFMTVLSLLVYAIGLEMLRPTVAATGVSDDGLLNAIFGGVLGGVSSGMILRGGGTAGGTATLARILQYRYGLPMSSAYLYTDTGTIILAGLAFGWEAVMLALLSMFVGGVATDYFLEGPSVIRTATIITDYPEEVSNSLLHTLRRGVTAWQGMGMYTHESRHILFITIHRAQVNELQELVHAIDPQAFVVIGQGHVAYGHGFKAVHPPPRETLSILKDKILS